MRKLKKGVILYYCLLAMLMLQATVLLGAVAQAGNPRSAFEGDMRLLQPVSLDGTTLSIGQAVRALGDVAKISLSVDDGIASYSAVVISEKRPAREILEAVALSSGASWSKTNVGYRLQYDQGVPQTVSNQIESLALENEETLKVKIEQPVLLAMNPPNLERGEEGFGPSSFGAATIAVGRMAHATIVAQTPALVKQLVADKGGRQWEGKQVLARLARRTGGTWKKLGGAYVLTVPPADLSLQRLSPAERLTKFNTALDAALGAISDAQLAKLRKNETIPFAQFSSTQQARLRNVVLYHYSLFPLYDRAVVEQAADWNLSGYEKGVMVNVGDGHTLATVEWDTLTNLRVRP